MVKQRNADERLLALWHTLDSSELGRTKADLRRVVPGYGELESDEAFERMFSRDKASLRKAGVEIETTGVGTLRERYRLNRGNPGPIVDLTPAEVGAVRLAARLWQSGDLGNNAQNAASRIVGEPASVSEGEAAEQLFSAPIPFIPAFGNLFHPLVQAIEDRREVEFAYRNAATGEARLRLVQPWRLAFRDGGWYLLGKDTELGQARAFRLSRICSAIKVFDLRHAFRAVTEVDVGGLLGETGHFTTATLAIAQGRAARLRAGNVAGTTATSDVGNDPKAARADGGADYLSYPQGYEIIKYHYDNEREFADELAGLGSNVVVVGPAQLKLAVVKRLKAARQMMGA